LRPIWGENRGIRPESARTKNIEWIIGLLRSDNNSPGAFIQVSNWSRPEQRKTCQ
jgi:hypothetical protein